MNEENVLVITDIEELYDKCENMEQLFDKYYLPLLNIHYKKSYQLQEENQQLKSQLEQSKNETKQRDDVIDECKKFVSSLSSKGRDCMIYYDVKKDILSILNKRGGTDE